LGVTKTYKNVETTAYKALRTLLENTNKNLFEDHASKMVKLRKLHNLLEDVSNNYPSLRVTTEQTNKLLNISEEESKNRTLTG
jgi:hypothetical protein